MRLLVISMVLFFLTACGGGGGGAPASQTPVTDDPVETGPVLEQISLNPYETSIPLGTSLTLTATGIYSDQSSADISDSVTWEIENQGILSYEAGDEFGKIRALALGQCRVRAVLGSISAQRLITVTAAVLEQVIVFPNQVSLAAGMETPLQATGFFSDQSSRDITDDIVWTVAHPDIASVSGGILLGKASGITGITAAFGGQQNSLTATITDAVLDRLEVSPAVLSLAAGLSADYHVTGIFSDSSKTDLTGQVSWQSSDPETAHVSSLDNTAALVSLQDGEVTITAGLNGKIATSHVTVTEARLSRIEINPEDLEIAKGLSNRLGATGIYTDNSSKDITGSALWTSSDDSLAMVSNAGGSKGLMTAINTGSVTISASIGEISTSTSVTVGDPVLESLHISGDFQALPAGLTRPFRAMGNYSDDSFQDLTQAVTWITSDSQVAVINNGSDKGHLTGVAQGDITVSAYLGQIGDSLSVTISDAILTAIAISPNTGVIPAGQSLQFTATGTYSDLSTVDITPEVLWMSSNTTVALADNAQESSGTVYALQPGDVTITASRDGVDHSVTITITSATLTSIEVLPTGDTLPSGLILQYQALGHFSDGSVQDLTRQALWQVSDKTKASISNLIALKGLLYAFAPGTVTVTASVGNTQQSTGLTITGATLTSVRFSPAYAVMDQTSTMNMTLEGVFSDGSVQDLTSQALWISFNTQVVTVSNVPGEEGTLTGIGVGQTQVLAVLGQVGFVAPIKVLKPVDHIEIHSVSSLILLDWSLAYSATAYYEDGTSEDVTGSVLWASSDPDVADFYDFGRLLGLSDGTTEISVSINGTVYDTADLDVIALQELQMGNQSLGGGAVQFSAYGIYRNDQAINLTEFVTWSSDNEAVLTISNEAGEKGLAQILQIGISHVTAVYDDGLSVTQTVTIQ